MSLNKKLKRIGKITAIVLLVLFILSLADLIFSDSSPTEKITGFFHLIIPTEIDLIFYFISFGTIGIVLILVSIWFFRKYVKLK